MAAIASRLQIAEIQSQITSLLNGYFMIGMQVPFAAIMSIAKLGEHYIGGRLVKVEPAAVRDDIRFPPAIYAAPAIALETEKPQPAVVCIVPALGTGATAHVMFTLSRDPV